MGYFLNPSVRMIITHLVVIRRYKQDGMHSLAINTIGDTIISSAVNKRYDIVLKGRAVLLELTYVQNRDSRRRKSCTPISY